MRGDYRPSGLAAITLEVRDLQASGDFYAALGLQEKHRDDAMGELEFAINEDQSLRLWQPKSGQKFLSPIYPRGGSHVHYALKIPQGSKQQAIHTLKDNSIDYQLHEIVPGDEAIYFFDPDGHQVELGESSLYQPGEALVRAFREVVLEFEDLHKAHDRLQHIFNFEHIWGSPDSERAFTAYLIGDRPTGEVTNGLTELFCWDPQIGVGGGQPGEHVYLTLTYPKSGLGKLGLDATRAGMQVALSGGSLFVRDLEDHVFEFRGE